MKTALTLFLQVLALGVAVLLVADVAYLFHGSFEAFPTPEQEEKSRIGAGVMGVFLLFCEVVLIRSLRQRPSSNPGNAP